LLPVAVLPPRVGRAVSLGLSGVGDGRGHMLVVGVLVVGVLVVGVLVVGVLVVGVLVVGVLVVGVLVVGVLVVRVGGRGRRSGTVVSIGNYVIEGEL